MIEEVVLGEQEVVIVMMGQAGGEVMVPGMVVGVTHGGIEEMTEALIVAPGMTETSGVVLRGMIGI